MINPPTQISTCLKCLLLALFKINLTEADKCSNIMQNTVENYSGWLCMHLSWVFFLLLFIIHNMQMSAVPDACVPYDKVLDFTTQDDDTPVPNLNSKAAVI